MFKTVFYIVYVLYITWNIKHKHQGASAFVGSVQILGHSHGICVTHDKYYSVCFNLHSKYMHAFMFHMYCTSALARSTLNTASATFGCNDEGSSVCSCMGKS